MKAISDSGSKPARTPWRLELDVRGERVQGRLFVSKKADKIHPPLVVWLHAQADEEREARLNSSEVTLLELHWPLIGPRQDAKLSPVLARCVLDPEDASSASEALWERFSQQTCCEISAVLAGLQSQTECPIGEFSELILDLSFGEKTGKHSVCRSSAHSSLDASGCVREFLSQLRPPPSP
jgi:hypothetical protein